MSEETNESGGSRADEGKSQGRSRRRRRRRSRGKNEAGGEQKKASEGQDQKKAGGGGSGGGSRKRRRSRGRSRSRQDSRKSSGRRNKDSQPRQPANKRKPKTPQSKFGGREPRATLEPSSSNGPREITPFELFCVYHLGIAEDNRYRQQNVRDVARRFDCSPHELEEALKRFGLDKDTLRQAGYDISLAQLDMQVAPEGVDKRELAKVLFSEFLELTPEVATRIEQASEEVVAED
ncbi:MAG: hypothetical protein ACNA8W_05845 [Bradymonadaceae bacterium]